MTKKDQGKLQKEDILGNIDAYLHTERIQNDAKSHANSDLDEQKAIISANLKAAGSSKQILSKLYVPVATSGSKIKKWIITKVSNIVRNTVERPLTTQQKYNQQVYTIISELEKRISELEKKHESAN